LPATARFTFDLMGPLISQIDACFNAPALVAEPLAPAQLQFVEATPGLYQLFHLGQRVYVGKADRDLHGRLDGHYRKIAARMNINVSDMTFLGLYMEATWLPVGAENGLIELYDGPKTKPVVHLLPWNNNGFGINDPGKERDTTTFKATHFDVLYPANLDLVVPGLAAGTYAIDDLLRRVKNALPYVFRFEDQYARHADYVAHQAHLPQVQPTARNVFDALKAGLPPGWQITALPGYVVMYKSVRSFPSARQVWVS
jgi:hypothetical protein